MFLTQDLVLKVLSSIVPLLLATGKGLGLLYIIFILCLNSWLLLNCAFNASICLHVVVITHFQGLQANTI